MKNCGKILGTFMFGFSFLAFANDGQTNGTQKVQADIDIIKQKYSQNLFKDTQGLGANSNAMTDLLKQIQAGDELVIQFQYDRNSNLDPRQFPTTDEVLEAEKQAMAGLVKKDMAVRAAEVEKKKIREKTRLTKQSKLAGASPELEDTPKSEPEKGSRRVSRTKMNEAKQFEKAALTDMEKLIELKRNMMATADGKTFTMTVTLTDMQALQNRPGKVAMDPAQKMAKETIANIQRKNLKIVEVNRLPAVHAQAKNNLLRSISMGGLKKGLSGAIAAGAVSLSGIAEAATAEKSENPTFKLPIKPYQESKSQGAQ